MKTDQLGQGRAEQYTACGAAWQELYLKSQREWCFVGGRLLFLIGEHWCGNQYKIKSFLNFFLRDKFLPPAGVAIPKEVIALLFGQAVLATFSSSS